MAKREVDTTGVSQLIEAVRHRYDLPADQAKQATGVLLDQVSRVLEQGGQVGGVKLSPDGTLKKLVLLSIE